MTEPLWTIRFAGPPAPPRTVTTTELDKLLRDPARPVFDVKAVPREHAPADDAPVRGRHHATNP